MALFTAGRATHGSFGHHTRHQIPPETADADARAARGDARRRRARDVARLGARGDAVVVDVDGDEDEDENDARARRGSRGARGRWRRRDCDGRARFGARDDARNVRATASPRARDGVERRRGTRASKTRGGGGGASGVGERERERVGERAATESGRWNARWSGRGHRVRAVGGITVRAKFL